MQGNEKLNRSALYIVILAGFLILIGTFGAISELASRADRAKTQREAVQTLVDAQRATPSQALSDTAHREILRLGEAKDSTTFYSLIATAVIGIAIMLLTTAGIGLYEPAKFAP